MALVPCPACGLPRTAADAAAAPCPTCQWADAAPPRDPAPPPTPAVPPTPEAVQVQPRNRLLLAGGSAVLVGVLAVLLAWPGEPSEPTTPPPDSVVLPPVEPPPPPAPLLPPPPPPREPPEPVVVVVPVPVPVDPTNGFAVLKLDQPEEPVQFPRLGAGNRVKLIGRVKRLSLEGLEGGAELDATGLANDGVSVGRIVGSTLRVKTDGMTVSFKDGVQDRSVVELDAPRAHVTFSAGKGGPVGGRSRVTVKARAVVVEVPVKDAGTVLDLTFSPGGSLRYTTVEAKGVVRYRPEHRADPPVRVTPGRVATGGQVVEEPPPKR